MDIPVDFLAGHWLGLSDRSTRDPAESCGSRLERRFLAADPVQQYCLFTPATLQPDPAVLVAVHGIGQTAADQVRCLAPLAEAAGVLLVTPMFARERFPHYQRLGRAGEGFRADLVLNEILRDVGNLHPESAERVHLLGQAGGGQFVHRYVMAHPARVQRYAVSAVGAYTLPNRHLNFPFGVRPSPDLPSVAPDPRAFLAVPGCVIGSAHGPYRARGLSRTDPSALGDGVAHIDRGRRWAAVMNRTAGMLGLPPPIRFITLPRLGRIFGPGPLAVAAFEFLFGRDLRTEAAGTEGRDRR